jgi:hypothetical protein
LHSFFLGSAKVCGKHAPSSGSWRALMTRRNLIAIFVVAAFAFIMRAAVAAESAGSKVHYSLEAKRMMSLVDQASKLVEQKGRHAFPELRKDKKWNNGDLYIFIDRFDGVVLLLPPTPEI